MPTTVALATLNESPDEPLMQTMSSAVGSWPSANVAGLLQSPLLLTCFVHCAAVRYPAASGVGVAPETGHTAATTATKPASTSCTRTCLRLTVSPSSCELFGAEPYSAIRRGSTAALLRAQPDRLLEPEE